MMKTYVWEGERVGYLLMQSGLYLSALEPAAPGRRTLYAHKPPVFHFTSGLWVYNVRLRLYKTLIEYCSCSVIPAAHTPLHESTPDMKGWLKQKR